MAEYSKQLNLFLPGTDDDVGIEESLRTNFQKIDDKVGTALKDLNGKEFGDLGERMNDYQKSQRDQEISIAKLNKKSPNARIDHHFFSCIAQKGAYGTAPENTLAAYMYAIDMGFWGIKANIALTSDNQWVCFGEGEDLAKTTNGSGTVSSKTLAELKKLDAGSKYHSSFANERIPTVDQFLQICMLGNVVPYLELPALKDYTDTQIQSLVTMITNMHLEDVAVIVSQHLKSLKQVRYYSDFMALGYMLELTPFNQTSINDAESLGNAFILAQYPYISPANMKLAEAKHIQVEAWTIWSTMELRKMIGLGIRGAVTQNIPFVRGY